MEVVAIAVMGIILAASAGLAVRASGALMALVETLGRVRSEPGSTRGNGEPLTRGTPHVLIADYIDRQLLNEIAEQKGVGFESTTVEFGTGISEREELRAAVRGEVGAPGGFAKGGLERASARATEASERLSVSLQRRQSMRAQIERVLEALERDGQLLTDLDFVSRTGLIEATYVQAVGALHYEWELDDVMRKPNDHAEGGETEPTDDDEQSLRELGEQLHDLSFQASRICNSEKLKELTSRLPSITDQLALIESNWWVKPLNGDFELRLATLRTPPFPEPRSDINTVPAYRLITVPAESEHLTAHGRQRFQQQVVNATVFGRVQGLASGEQSLRVLPIVIYSSGG